MSWFWRGVQSAIFYYVSCAPCTKWNYQRKTKIHNKRLKAQKADLEEARPDVQHHPSPFTTNIYWREEIALGPGPPPKKKDRDKAKAGSSRELNTGGQGSSAGASSADTTLAVESVEEGEVGQERDSEEGWNWRRYQRPDEALWGADNGQESEIGLSGISRTTTTGSGTYYTSRNPAVNDLHPPIVSTHPTRKSETRWMLQPPPSAKVMAGKERANRSRSVSGGSYGSSKAVGLRRQVSERLMEEKFERGEKLPGPDVPLLELPPSSRGGKGSSDPSAHSQGQLHERDPQPYDDSRLSETSNRYKQPPPINISEDIGSRSRSRDVSRTPSTSNISRPPPLRPPLSTIVSSSENIPTTLNRSLSRPVTSPAPSLPKPKPKDNPSFWSASRNTQAKPTENLPLQELMSPDSVLNSRAPSPANIGLPSATPKEEEDLALSRSDTKFSGLGIESTDREGWQYPTMELGDGRERWSVGF